MNALDASYQSIATLCGELQNRTDQFRAVHAGIAIKRTIENLRNAYVVLPQGVIGIVNGAIQDLRGSPNKEVVQGIINRVQTVANQMPVFGGPVTSGTWPAFALRTQEMQNNVIMHCVGNFPDVPDRHPRLQLDGGEIEPAASSSYELQFAIPAARFHHDLRRILFLSGQLHVPRAEGGEAIFSVTIGAFPQAAARVVSTVCHVIAREFRALSHNFHIDSCRHEPTTCEQDGQGFITGSVGGHNNDEKPNDQYWEFIARATPGWTIANPDPIERIRIKESRGDFRGPDLVSVWQNGIICRARTIHHGVGTSGSIDFTLFGNEFRDDLKEKTAVPPNPDVLWKSRGIVVTPPQNWDKSEYCIHVETFDGSKYVWKNNGPSLHSPFIEIHNQGHQFVIQPKTIVELEE